MKKNPTAKGRKLMLFGTMFLILSLVLFKENNAPKFMMMGASIVLLALSIYHNTRDLKK